MFVRNLRLVQRPVTLRCRCASRQFQSKTTDREKFSGSALWSAALVTANVYVATTLQAHTPSCAEQSTPQASSFVHTRDCPEEVYKMGPVLGEGSFSQVRLGENRKTGEVVAIKEMSKLDTSASRFRAEIDILLQVHLHPNIPTVIRTFETDSEWYIVTEVADGGELFERIVTKGPFSDKQAREAIKDIAETIAYLHNQGIVHCDIKPENVVLKSKNCDKPFLIDYGTAFRLRDVENGTKCTSSGTPGYSSPEQISDHKCCAASDIWALGVLAYISLCGRHPFDPDNTMDDDEIEQSILTGQYSLDRPEISPHARDLLKKILRRDPLERPSVEEILDHPWFSDGIIAEPVQISSFRHEDAYRAFSLCSRSALKRYVKKPCC
jgi:calcium/calmodulin-dependent protein kinase I